MILFRRFVPIKNSLTCYHFCEPPGPGGQLGYPKRKLISKKYTSYGQNYSLFFFQDVGWKAIISMCLWSICQPCLSLLSWTLLFSYGKPRSVLVPDHIYFFGCSQFGCGIFNSGPPTRRYNGSHWCFCFAQSKCGFKWNYNPAADLWIYIDQTEKKTTAP